jgi:hypothetical protein
VALNGDHPLVTPGLDQLLNLQMGGVNGGP